MSLLERVQEDREGLAILALVVLAAGLFNRFTGTSSDKHALIFVAIVAGTGWVTWQITHRTDLSWLAAATVGLWSIPRATPREHLWIALVPLAILAVPPKAWTRLHDAALAIPVGLAAAGLTAWLTPDAFAIALAGGAGFLVTMLRPETPTRETTGAVRTGALLLPGGVFLALLGVNAGIGWFEPLDAEAAVWTGIGLLGLLVLLALAGLGLATLLESDDPGQRSAWLAIAIPLACLVAVVPLKDLSLLQAVGALAVGPVVLLAVIAAARFDAGGVPQPVGFAVPLLASLAQFGL